MIKEQATHKTKWIIEKFADEKATSPYEVSVIHGNILVNAGINLMWDLVCGAGGTAFSQANSYMGVGDSSTAVDASQTNLQASTNKVRVSVNAGSPTTGTAQKAVWIADFGASDANFAWEEFAIFNASTAGTMLNRKVDTQGVKVSGQVWRLTLEITLS